MFPTGYFADRFFPPSYWAKTGLDPIEDVATNKMLVPVRKVLDAIPALRTQTTKPYRYGSHYRFAPEPQSPVNRQATVIQHPIGFPHRFPFAPPKPIFITHRMDGGEVVPQLRFFYSPHVRQRPPWPNPKSIFIQHAGPTAFDPGPLRFHSVAITARPPVWKMLGQRVHSWFPPRAATPQDIKSPAVKFWMVPRPTREWMPNPKPIWRFPKQAIDPVLTLYRSVKITLVPHDARPPIRTPQTIRWRGNSIFEEQTKRPVFRAPVVRQLPPPVLRFQTWIPRRLISEALRTPPQYWRPVVVPDVRLRYRYRSFFPQAGRSQAFDPLIPQFHGLKVTARPWPPPLTARWGPWIGSKPRLDDTPAPDPAGGIPAIRVFYRPHVVPPLLQLLRKQPWYGDPAHLDDGVRGMTFRPVYMRSMVTLPPMFRKAPRPIAFRRTFAGLQDHLPHGRFVVSRPICYPVAAMRPRPWRGSLQLLTPYVPPQGNGPGDYIYVADLLERHYIADKKGR